MTAAAMTLNTERKTAFAKGENIGVRFTAAVYNIFEF